MELEVVRCKIPDRLRSLGMTQQDLADRTGLTKTQISDYISLRKIMSLKSAFKVAYVLKCHIEELYVWKRSDGK